MSICNETISYTQLKNIGATRPLGDLGRTVPGKICKEIPFNFKSVDSSIFPKRNLAKKLLMASSNFTLNCALNLILLV